MSDEETLLVSSDGSASDDDNDATLRHDDDATNLSYLAPCPIAPRDYRVLVPPSLKSLNRRKSI